MNINYKDKSKPFTAEDLIRRYNLENLSKDRKAINTLNDGLTKTNSILEDFTREVTKDIKELQNQVDGNITTWFLNGVPTLENSPANEWTTPELKNNHLGDMYYDQETGYAYRFVKDEENYKWLQIVDSTVTEALAIANAAKDTADSKRRVFVAEPKPPYDVGDMWIKEYKDLYCCITEKTEGAFNEVDWILATDYSNDDYAKNVEAVLNQFKETVESNYATTVMLNTTKDSIESKVQSNTTEIRNNYIAINESLNEYAKVETVTEQISSVQNQITSNEQKITVINDTIENGVSKVKTEKGFTFNDEGLTIDELNAKVKNTLDETGMEITEKVTGDSLLFAGYDEETNETIVKSKNLTVQKYLNIPHARYESYNNSKFGLGTGCFFIE